MQCCFHYGSGQINTATVAMTTVMCTFISHIMTAHMHVHNITMHIHHIDIKTHHKAYMAGFTILRHK